MSLFSILIEHGFITNPNTMEPDDVIKMSLGIQSIINAVNEKFAVLKIILEEM